MKNGIRAIVATPVQQHSYKTAVALKKTSSLLGYYTTVYYSKDKLLYKILKLALNQNNLKRMLNKRDSSLDEDVRTGRELLGLIYLCIIRFDKAKIITPLYKRFLCNRFSSFVYKNAIKDKANIIVMNDLMAFETFNKFKRTTRSPILVLDMASVPASFIREAIDREQISGDPFIDDLNAFNKSYSLKYLEYYNREIEMADYFFAASSFTKNQLILKGIDENRIYYLPLGVDVVSFPIKQVYTKKDRLKFLFVGRVESAKGVFYLLEAFKAIQDLPVELVIAGEVNCDIGAYSEIKNITFLGEIQKDRMSQIYQSADVYILSSLWEGFSLSLFEAMSSGIPVIASLNSCAPDVITEGEEGLIYDPFDSKALVSKIMWFVSNSDKIEIMGRKAHSLAEKYSWDAYSEKLNSIIKEIAKKEQIK